MICCSPKPPNSLFYIPHSSLVFNLTTPLRLTDNAEFAEALRDGGGRGSELCPKVGVLYGSPHA